jgi:hypothetical protein
MAIDETHDALNEELRLLEKEIAELRGETEELRSGLADGEDDPGDFVDHASRITMAEEQEAFLATLESRRQDLLRQLGRT